MGKQKHNVQKPTIMGEKKLYTVEDPGEGPGGSAPPAPLFLDQTEARIISFAALLGERCVTSEKKNHWRPPRPPSPI